MPRHFFNETSRDCEPFVYGGCGGNQNNFFTKDDCERFARLKCLDLDSDSPILSAGMKIQQQIVSSAICNLPSDTGICRGYFPRFFYNMMSKQCETFIYGGCGGNANNFRTKIECENFSLAKCAHTLSS